MARLDFHEVKNVWFCHAEKGDLQVAWQWTKIFRPPPGNLRYRITYSVTSRMQKFLYSLHLWNIISFYTSLYNENIICLTGDIQGFWSLYHQYTYWSSQRLGYFCRWLCSSNVCQFSGALLTKRDPISNSGTLWYIDEMSQISVGYVTILKMVINKIKISLEFISWTLCHSLYISDLQELCVGDHISMSISGGNNVQCFMFLSLTMVIPKAMLKRKPPISFIPK